jgi:hypothetical protein
VRILAKPIARRVTVCGGAFLGLISLVSGCASLSGLSGGADDAGEDAGRGTVDVGAPRPDVATEHRDARSDRAVEIDAKPRIDAGVHIDATSIPDGGDADRADAVVESGPDVALACDAGASGVGMIGCACAPSGALACGGNGQTVATVCTGGAWAYRTTCSSGEVCDTTTGATEGTCAMADPLCATAHPGENVCKTDTTVVQCGPDLLTDSPVKTCVAQACVSGACSGVCSPGATRCATATEAETCSASGQWGTATACPVADPSCIGTACAPAVVTPPTFFVGAIGPSTSAISATASASTKVGDLILICIYIEPTEESSAMAAYPAFTLPSGFSVASWEPISSNDANLTTEETNRQYVFWGYATTAGAITYSVATTASGYIATAIVTVHGAATSGNPFADVPSKASYGDGAAVSVFPSVSVTPAANGTGFLWFGTAWSLGGHFGNPVGFTSLLEAQTLSISVLAQSTKATETVAPSVLSTNLLTASLMTFR